MQIVVVRKLRRGESFLISWKDSDQVGSGRSSIWIHPYVLVHFKFEGSRTPEINEEWLAELTASADSSRGLIITKEHGALQHLEGSSQRRFDETVVEPTERPDRVTA